jgi:bifunctional isochorismate lyase/aryl carrier protein
MTIPTIEQYAMPGAERLPGNQVSWRLRAGRAALLIHDMQNYFVGFLPAGRPPRADLLRHSASLRALAHHLGMPVVYSAQPGRMTSQQRGLLADVWGPGMDGEHQRQVVAELAPADGDIVVTKWRYSAFSRTDLAGLLRRMGRDQLLICGVYAHLGCLLTACDAFALDIQPFLVADAVADFSLEYHQLALRFAAERCAAVLPVVDVARALQETPLAASTRS